MFEWKYVKQIKGVSLITEAQRELGIRFDEEYISTVKKYNGGSPPLDTFDTDKAKEHTIKSLLSLNKEDIENIYTANAVVTKINKNIVPFAIDDFGNYICFEKSNCSVVFLNFETGEIEKVTSNFAEFLKVIAPKSVCYKT